MEPKPLVVRVEDINTREAWFYVFEQSPVWVGCGPESSLLIVRPFISLQHGCFRFDAQGVRYQDLDPAVGTLVDGEPAAGREVTLSEWTQVEMGDLRITVSRRPPELAVSDPALSPFGRSAAPGWPAPAPAPLPAPEPLSALSAPLPVMPATLVLPDAAVSARPRRAASDAWSEIVPPEDLSPAPVRRPSTAAAKPVRRRKRGRAKRFFSRALLWLSAMGIGAAILAVAGLLLQYRGLPWMPPELVARIPPWLANLFR
ncbi:MAG TPA: FHA domain-containing protein [Polyangia bacterium]|nr:FHA domain-containing protein [Polyangia bacterium]